MKTCTSRSQILEQQKCYLQRANKVCLLDFQQNLVLGLRLRAALSNMFHCMVVITNTEIPFGSSKCVKSSSRGRTKGSSASSCSCSIECMSGHLWTRGRVGGIYMYCRCVLRAHPWTPLPSSHPSFCLPSDVYSCLWWPMHPQKDSRKIIQARVNFAYLFQVLFRVST